MPLRVYLVYDGERHESFIPDGALVADVKQEVKNLFLLGGDDGKADKKVVVLNYLGADLKDDWSFQDIGVMPGATIRIGEKEEKMPRLYVNCSFNNSKLKIMKEIDVMKITVAELRTIVATLVGLPVGVFRLTTSDGRELFDIHILDKYDIEIGDTIHLHTWDGWTDFLNLCMMGYTAHVFAQLSDNDLISRYQMKVAMHIACHFGHIDLMLNLMKQGVRADDPVGYHPCRQWCNVEPHIDSLKPPIHECGEQGQTACMRAIVNYNVTAITSKDGNDKTAFQIALMAKQKATAGFLLGKQWSRIQYGPPSLGITLPLNIYSKLKNWCERARDRNYIANGPNKSSMKRRPYITMGGTLVGLGVLVDGFTPSVMNGKSEPPPPDSSKNRTFLILSSDKTLPKPKQYFKSILNQSRGGKQSRAKIANQLNKGVRGMSKTDCILEEGNSATAHHRQDDTSADEEFNSRMSEMKQANARAHRFSCSEATVLARKRRSSSGISESQQKQKETADISSDDGECVKLPQLNRKTSKINMAAKSSKGSESADNNYIETGKDDDKDRTKSRAKSREEKKERMVISAMKKAKVKTNEYSIPLPLINTENTTRPYIQHNIKGEDPALSTLALYEKYRGMKSREYAIKCLAIANNFKDKPWLQQVRLAMDLTAQEVKKRVRGGSNRNVLATKSV